MRLKPAARRRRSDRPVRGARPPARRRRGPAADRPRLRDRARERGRGDGVRAVLARAVPRPDAHRGGRARPRLLRDRPRLARQLPRDGVRPVPDARDAGRLPALPRRPARPAGARRPGPRPGLRLPPRGAARRRPAADRGLTWKGYMEDMGADPARDNGTACAHPAIGTADRTQQASPTDQYATRHNPFVYFHSIIDDPAGCAARDVPLTQLEADLGSAATTPNLSFVVPDLCHDGHDATCADGTPGGLPAADAFLRTWVPRITSSPAFAADGLLVVTFDEAADDSSACCGERPGPNTPAPGGQSGGPGGGRVGAVLLSPFVAPGTVSAEQYNHYGLLRSIEDVFGLSHLGYAGAGGVRPFGADVYTAG